MLKTNTLKKILQIINNMTIKMFELVSLLIMCQLSSWLHLLHCPASSQQIFLTGKSKAIRILPARLHRRSRSLTHNIYATFIYAATAWFPYGSSGALGKKIL